MTSAIKRGRFTSGEYEIAAARLTDCPSCPFASPHGASIHVASSTRQVNGCVTMRPRTIPMAILISLLMGSCTERLCLSQVVDESRLRDSEPFSDFSEREALIHA